jgi:hypothetical protein
VDANPGLSREDQHSREDRRGFGPQAGEAQCDIRRKLDGMQRGDRLAGILPADLRDIPEHRATERGLLRTSDRITRRSHVQILPSLLQKPRKRAFSVLNGDRSAELFARLLPLANTVGRAHDAG